MTDADNSGVVLIKIKVHRRESLQAEQVVTIWFRKGNQRGAVMGFGESAGAAVEDAMLRAAK